MSIDLIFAELDKVPDRAPVVKSDSIWIRCSNPEHSGGYESTPSCKINLEEGPFQFRSYCFGCHESLHWNGIAKRLDLERIDKDFKPVGNRRLRFKERVANRKNGGRTMTYLKEVIFFWPKEKEWRGISGKILARDKVGITETKHDLEEPRLIFPVTVFGEEVGRIYALMREPRRDAKGKKIEEPYINSPGDWKERSLFAFDRARKLLKKKPYKPLWIVEGSRDTYHMYDSGSVAVGALGSSFSAEKGEVVKLLNPPFVIVGSDADDAGDKLAEDIHEHLHGNIPLFRFRWQQDCDPCDYSKDEIKKIENKICRAMEKKYGIKGRSKSKRPESR